MAYYIDLTAIDITEYQSYLEEAELLPSRQVLKDNLEENFHNLKKAGIKNLEELLDKINTRNKEAMFSKETGIDLGYLTILSREIRSYRPKPNRLKDFPNQSGQAIDKLAEIGIKNSQQLFNQALLPADREKIVKQTGIEPKDLLSLTKLSDLSRIRWVNHTFAFMLLKAGYDTVEKVALGEATEICAAVNLVNQDHGFYKGKIGLHDIELCVNSANDLSIDLSTED